VATHRVNTVQRGRGTENGFLQQPLTDGWAGGVRWGRMMPLTLRGDGSTLEVERLRQQLVGSDAGLEIVDEGTLCRPRL
jgi:hypothetical protein